MADLSQVSLKNPFELNSIVKSTLLGVELVCCLQHSVTIVCCKILRNKIYYTPHFTEIQ